MVGEQQWREEAAQFLDSAALGPAGLVIEGEIGAGKSTILRAVVAAAVGRGVRMLRAHPAEAEAVLAFAGLRDLLADALEHEDVSLPAPQERALRIAALLEDPDAGQPDQLAVAAAALGFVRSLARRGPILIAIDDLQWLDAPTIRILEFVFRRLAHEPVGLILARRTTDRAPGRPLESALSPERVVHLVPAPFDADRLDELFRLRLGASLPRPTLVAIAKAAGGNPMFALEIARAIQRGEIRPSPGERLPVPQTLGELVAARLDGLPPDVRKVLAIASASFDPTVALLDRVVSSSVVEDAIAAALRFGIVELDGDRIRFTHPLFASTLYHGLSRGGRKHLHRQLADVSRDPLDRAHHLSLAADSPDPGVAAVLDAAATEAARRGAPDAAADLCLRALELTPDADPEVSRRRIRAAEYRFDAGDTAGARREFEAIVRTQSPGPERADVLRRLARVRYRNDSCAVAAELLTRAAAEPELGVTLRAEIQRDLSWAVGLCGDVVDADRHARAALELIRGDPGHQMYPELVAATSLGDFLLGRPVDRALLEAVASGPGRPGVPIEWRPGMVLGMIDKWSGDLGAATRRFEEFRGRAQEQGDEASLPFLLFQLSETAAWQGDWPRARRLAEDSNALAHQTAQEPIRALALYARALAEALLGNEDEAATTARDGLELSREVGSVLSMMLNQAVLGFVELARGGVEEAQDWLGPLTTWREVVGIREPGVVRFETDAVEVLVALGRVDEAGRLLDSFQDQAVALGRTWAILAAARVRALLTAARGDLPAASRALQQALQSHGAGAPPFDRARALLTLGSIERRTRRKAAARRTLQAALHLFEELGARRWCERTLDALGGGAHAGSLGPGPSLTPAEERVARLVAGGASNRQVADRLFISVRGVESHLTTIYRKLGIRSRTQLTARLVARTPEDAPGVAGVRLASETQEPTSTSAPRIEEPE